MSKLKSDKLKFDDDNFVIDFNNRTVSSFPKDKQEDNEDNIVINRAEQKAKEIIREATIKAREIISKAQTKENSILKDANNKAQEIIDNAQKEAELKQQEAQKLVDNSKENIEKETIEATKKGYEDGHQEGVSRALEELEEKISAFDKFCALEQDIKNKTLKSSDVDILNVISNITRKVLEKEIDSKSLDKIIKKTLNLLEKRDDVSIIVSQKYAKLLFALQNKDIEKELDEIDFDINQFKQYGNFEIIPNPNAPDDTIIVENIKERFDASISAQLDIILKDIYNGSLGSSEEENQ